MNLVLLNGAEAPLVLEREKEGIARREDVLRDLLFDHPEMLPIKEIDPSFGQAISVAKEMIIPDVGRIDALLVDSRGRLVIVECKLWRNPQARREVVGQILDYAQALSEFSYEALQRQISMATKRSGNVLYDMVCEAGSTIDEAQFVDQVSRDLERGRFLLLIVGDGITTGTQRIGEFLGSHAALAFDFGMIEMAQYRYVDPVTGAERTIVQPRLLAKTAVIERAVIRNEAVGTRISSVVGDSAAETVAMRPASEESQRAMLEWRNFVEKFAAQLHLDDPAQQPPKSGGLNWMRLPLPGPAHLTLWRGKSEGIGAFVTYKGSEGLATYEMLCASRDNIDLEFSEQGLPAPQWQQSGDSASIAVGWPSPPPWTADEEARQITLLSQAANGFVNSLRPRLLGRSA